MRVNIITVVFHCDKVFQVFSLLPLFIFFLLDREYLLFCCDSPSLGDCEDLLFEMNCYVEVGFYLVTACYNLEADEPIIVFMYDILMELQNALMLNYEAFGKVNKFISEKADEIKVSLFLFIYSYSSFLISRQRISTSLMNLFLRP